MIDEGSGSAVLESKDKNMTNVLASLLAEEKEPTVDLPSISLTVPSNGSGEVGNTFILPTATFKVTDVGSYSYGSKDANGVIDVNEIVVEIPKLKEENEVKEMTIDDFINDFKL